MKSSKEAAQEKINRALEKIEAAQNLLSEACGELCPVAGMLKEWEYVGKIYDQSRDAWHLVNGRRHGKDIDLDSAAKRRFLEKAGA